MKTSRGTKLIFVELDIEIDRDEYVDGSNGVFADMYENCEHHGVGLW